MGKHGNQDNGKRDNGGTPGYEPKHAGGQDGYEWAKELPTLIRKDKKNG